VKEDQKRLLELEKIPSHAEEAPAHLSFRRLAVTDFSAESETESLRFYYRGHGKHLAARAAA
jgi:hypothetical protein